MNNKRTRNQVHSHHHRHRSTRIAVELLIKKGGVLATTIKGPRR
jgi:hypothetical protein